MDFLKKAMDGLKSTFADKPKSIGLGEVDDIGSQPPDQQDLISHIKNKLQTVRQSNSRVAQEGVWMTNYAYLMGFNSVYYDTNSRQYRPNGAGVGAFNRGPGISINKILPTVQRRQARLCKNQPRYEVRPDDASQDSRDKARLEQEVLDSYWEKERINDKRLNMMVGLQACGHFYLSVNWNTQKGEQILAVDDNGGQMAEYEGDIDVDIKSPFSVFPDPLATSPRDASWMIEANVRGLEYFRSHYKEFGRGELVKEEGAWLNSIQNELRIQSMVGQGPAQSGTNYQMQNAAIEIIYYEKRSEARPNGRMVITASGVLLHDGDLPVGEFPLVKFDDMPITGKYYPEAIITHLRPIQDQFNRLISKRSQWTNLMLAGKWICARGHQLQQESLSTGSGEVVWYTPVPGASPPMQMQVPVIPQYAYEEEQRLNGMFYDIAGEGEVSRGIMPSSSIPAIGMELLLEQDQTRIGAETSQHEDAFSQLGGLILKYVEKFVSNDRLLKLSDPTEQYLVKRFTGGDLVSKHDVIVIKGSLAPDSTAMRRNTVLNLYQTGLLGDQTDPSVKARVLRDLEFGDTRSVWIDQSIDMSQIKQSIEMIESGLIPEVSEFDNHTLHLQEKNRYRKTDKFSSLDPKKQAIFLNDMDEHLQWIMKLTAHQFGMNPQPQADVDQAMAQQQQMQVQQGSDTIRMHQMAGQGAPQ